LIDSLVASAMVNRVKQPALRAVIVIARLAGSRAALGPCL
jgi:hypothetical protein